MSDDGLRETHEVRYQGAASRYPAFRRDRWPRNRYEAALRLSLPGRRVLDVGCGDGLLLYHLRDVYDELHGLEYALNRAAAARTALAGYGVSADIRTGSITDRLDYPDGFFDAVFAAAVLEFVPDLYGALGEMSRLLRSGGRLVWVSPNFLSLRRRLGLLTGRFAATSAGRQGLDVPSGQAYDLGTVHYFTWHTVEGAMRRVGIEPVKRAGFGRLGRVHDVWRTVLSPGIAVAGEKR